MVLGVGENLKSDNYLKIFIPVDDISHHMTGVIRNSENQIFGPADFDL